MNGNGKFLIRPPQNSKEGKKLTKKEKGAREKTG